MVFNSILFHYIFIAWIAYYMLVTIFLICTGAIHKAIIACSKAGKYRGNKLESGKSAKTDCKCQFLLKEDFLTNLWSISKAETSHNHPMNIDSQYHYASRRRQFLTLRSQVDNLLATKTPPVKLLAQLRANNRGTKIILLPKDISNRASVLARVNNGGKDSMEAMAVSLSPGGHLNNIFASRIRRDVNNHVIAIVWVYREFLPVWYRHRYVFVADTTFNTNRHKMPLHHVLGFTTQNKNFTCMLALMHKQMQKTGDYYWVWDMYFDILYEYMLTVASPEELLKIEVLNVVVVDRDIAEFHGIRDAAEKFKEKLGQDPKTTKFILCRWHFFKDVEAYAKGSMCFESVDAIKIWLDELRNIINELEVASYRTCLSQFLHETPSKVCDYLKKEWLPYEVMLSSCFINDAKHLGTTSTSRVEGAHHRLKTFLTGKKSSLHDVVKCSEDYFRQQTTTIQHAEAADQDRRSNLIASELLFLEVANEVSIYTMLVSLKIFVSVCVFYTLI